MRRPCWSGGTVLCLWLISRKPMSRRKGAPQVHQRPGQNGAKLGVTPAPGDAPGRPKLQPASDGQSAAVAALAGHTDLLLTQALPSSFVASAVCMFRPATARFDVYPRPTNATAAPLRCHRTTASAWGAHAHACKVDPEHGATWAHAGLPTPSSSKRHSVQSTATRPRPTLRGGRGR